MKKFKAFLGGRAALGGSGSFGPLGQGQYSGDIASPAVLDLVLIENFLQELVPTCPLEQRTKTLHTLLHQISRHGIELLAVESLWACIQDLLHDSEVPVATRADVWQLMQLLIRIHSRNLGAMRVVFFEDIRTGLREDLYLRIETLRLLSEGGKNLDNFEVEAGPFFVQVLYDCHSSTLLEPLLTLIADTIQFTAGHIDLETVAKIINGIHVICFQSGKKIVDNELLLFLKLLEAVIFYSTVPVDALEGLVLCLCLLVNRRKEAWSTARHLLGTHNGINALITMTRILENGILYSSMVVRGAVFLIGMALWGPYKVTSLAKGTSKVLDPMLKAMQYRDVMVAHEEVLAVHRLIRKNREEMAACDWSTFLDLVTEAVDIHQSLSTLQPEYQASLDNLLNTLEELHSANEFLGDEEALVRILESCYSWRQESSARYLIDVKVKYLISPLVVDQVDGIRNLLQMFFVEDKREEIRAYCLANLLVVYRACDILHEKDFISKIVLGFFHSVNAESAQIRQKVASVYLAVLQNSRISAHDDSLLKSLYGDVMDMMDHLLLDVDFTRSPVTQELFVVADGYCRIFEAKLCTLDCHMSVSIFKTFVVFLEKLLDRRTAIPQDKWLELGPLKEKIFTTINSLRCDSHGRLGSTASPIFSPLLVATQEGGGQMEMASKLRRPICFLDFKEALHVLQRALEFEVDWFVLKVVLESLCRLLQERDLVVRYPMMIGVLSIALCRMIKDRKLALPERLLHGPVSIQVFHGLVFSVVVHLVGFPMQERKRQLELVEVLHGGLVPPCSRQCVSALSLALLEMPEAVGSVLHAVLLKMSQLSASAILATPVLEFLSTLVQVPSLYASFTDKQFITIFAIALPYTSPFRFNHYVVALAYHLIATWFLKCRLKYRRLFTTFIIKSLRSHVLRHLDEHEHHVTQLGAHVGGSLSALNESSEDRRRGFSLNERTMRRPHRFLSGAQRSAVSPVLGRPSRSNEAPDAREQVRAAQQRAVQEEQHRSSVLFHRELAEACAEMLARYTFSSVVSLPQRSPMTEWLFKEGHKQSWLLGNRVVTITTSKSPSSMKSRGCSRCRHSSPDVSARADAEPDDVSEVRRQSYPDKLQIDLAARRRHRSEAIERSSLVRPVQTGSTAASLDRLMPHHERPGTLPQEGPTRLTVNTEESSLSGDPSGGPCWCQDWAEITVNRPTGIVSWLVRLENPRSHHGIGDEGLRHGMDMTRDPQMLSANDFPNPGGSGDEPLLDVEASHVTDWMVIDGTIEPRVVPLSLERISRIEGLSVTDSSIKRTTSLPRLTNQDDPPTEAPNTSADAADDSSRGQEEEAGPAERPRSSTIGESNESAARARRRFLSGAGLDARTEDEDFAKMLFLQFYYSYGLREDRNERPVLLPQDDELVRTGLERLSRLPCYEVHALGLVYIGPEQPCTEAVALANQAGSARYTRFLHGLGRMVDLEQSEAEQIYTGGLDALEDGRWALVWTDDLIQVVFHVTTLMPAPQTEGQKHFKKRHVGNDYVTIVYNDGQDEWKPATITGQFQFINIVICPRREGYNLVKIVTKNNGVERYLGSLEPRIVSNRNLSALVRTLAIHANLASIIVDREQRALDPPFANCWVERLRVIKRLRLSADKANKNQQDPLLAEDFSDFV